MIDGITINIIAPPAEKTEPIGTYDTYEESAGYVLSAG